MRSVKKILKIVISALLSLVILNTVCSLYCGYEFKEKCTDGVTEYKGVSNSEYCSYTEGAHWGTLNNEGYGNLEDYHEGDTINVLVMGTSHFLGEAVNENERLTSVLNEIQDRYVYSIAFSNHRFPVNAQNLETAVEKYRPTDFVVIEYNAGISNSAISAAYFGKYDISSKFGNTSYNDFPFSVFLRRAYKQAKNLFDFSFDILHKNNEPAEQYVHRENDDNDQNDNIDDIGVLAQAGNNEIIEKNTDTKSENKGVTIETINRLFNKMSQTVSKSGSQIIIVYHPKTIISSNGDIVIVSPDGERDILSWACQDNNMIFLDMSERFAREYEDNHILPHGFINTTVSGGHLNAAGHRMVAEELALIMESEK